MSVAPTRARRMHDLVTDRGHSVEVCFEDPRRQAVRLCHIADQYESNRLSVVVLLTLQFEISETSTSRTFRSEPLSTSAAVYLMAS